MRLRHSPISIRYSAFAVAIAAFCLLPTAYWHDAHASCTNTPNIGLCKAARNDPDWDLIQNGNWDTLDSRFGASGGKVPPGYGGTGIDSSASTGTARVDDGTWSVGNVKLESYTQGTLPAAGTAGRMAYVTNNRHGIWIDNGTAWVPFDGVIKTQWFTGLADLGAQIQAAHDLSGASVCLTATGCTIETGDQIAAATLSAITITKPIRLKIGCGAYTVTGNLLFQNVINPVFDGSGGCTRLTWGGDSSTPMFTLDDVQRGVFRNFWVLASTTTPMQKAFRLINGSGSTVAMTSNQFENIEIECTNGGCTYGFHWDRSGGGGDNNNDFSVLSNVAVRNYSTAGFFNDAAQSVEHKFFNITASGNQVTGTSGVLIGSGGNAGGNFYWFGGNATANDSDFNLANAGARPHVIIGNDSENSVSCGDFTGAQVLVDVRNSRCATQRLNATTKRAFSYTASGRFVLDGNVIDARVTAAGITVTGTADNGSGVVRLTTATHGISTNDYIWVEGVGGTTEANGWWQVTIPDTTHIDLNGSAFANAWTSGGTVWKDAATIYCNPGSANASCEASNNIITSPLPNPLGGVANDWHGRGNKIASPTFDTQRNVADTTPSLSVGVGTEITKHLSATGTVGNGGSDIAANTCITDTITITGSATGDTVVLGPPSDIEASLTWAGAVTSANTVTVRLCNPTAGALASADKTWRADTWTH